MIALKLLIYFIIATVFTISLNTLLKTITLYRYSKHERYRLKRIELIFKRINRIDRFGNKTVDQRELIRLMQEYAMTTNNYENGVRMLNRIHKLANNTATIDVIARSKELLNERLKKNRRKTDNLEVA